MSPASADLRPILIADDDRDDLFFIGLALQEMEIEHPIVTTQDGAEAIDYLTGCIDTGRLPCMALLDIKMPRVSGFQVLEWARGRSSLSSVCFFVLSGSDLPEDRAKAFQLGARDYLVKYATADQLAGLVRQHCLEVVTAAR